MPILRPYFIPTLPPVQAVLQGAPSQLGGGSSPVQGNQYEQPTSDTVNSLLAQLDAVQKSRAAAPQNNINPINNSAMAITATPANMFQNTVGGIQEKNNAILQGIFDQLAAAQQLGQNATMASQAAVRPSTPAVQPVTPGRGYSGSGGSSGGSKRLSGDRGANQALGRQLLANMGWGNYWNAFNNLVMGESGWNNYAQNPTSTAYGIGQFLNSTWGSYGQKTSDPATQIQYMLQYIKNRYGNPANAWATWQSRSPHWY